MTKIQDNDRREDYVATASQTVFPYTFEIQELGDLAVYVNNVLQTVDTDYTVSNVGVLDGGNVTFLAGLVADDTVIINGDKAVQRLTEFDTAQQVVLGAELNTELEAQTIFARQNERDITRAMRAPVQDINPVMQLPVAATRAGKYLYFADPSGDPEPAELLVSGTVLSQSVVGGYLWPQSAREIAGGIDPPNKFYEPGDILRYGTITGTNDTAVFQSAVDANKGGFVLIPEGVTVAAEGVLLSGATYDSTTIKCRGTLKLIARGGANNFQSACFAGLIVHDTDNVVVEIHDSDGNRANQDDVEQIYILLIAGADNTRVPRFHTREIRGDGIHIAQATLTSSSANPTNTQLGHISGYNTVDDGRNLVSVIAGTGVNTIDQLQSYQIGGVINGFTMPGGLDLEPNAGYEPVEGWTIGSVNVVTAGTSGLAVLGKAITNDAARDWNIKDITIADARIVKTGTGGSGLSAATFARIMDCDINARVSYATTRGKGFAIDFADRITAELTARSVTQGVSLGTAEELRDSAIECNVSDYSQAGIRPCNLTRCKITGRVYGASGAWFAIQCHDEARGSITQTGVVYEVDAPHDGNNARAFRNEVGAEVSFVDCVARDCDWTGYTTYTVCFDAVIPKVNIRGVNWATSQPSNGSWHAEDTVRNSSPSKDVNNMLDTGWKRMNSSANNVAGTDWETLYVSALSPAD